MVSDVELRVAVLGLGYIGLPAAAVIARTGAKVLGVDVHQAVVDTINSGKVHIEEVDLDGLVSGVVARGDLRASLAIEPADVFVIAVPTPFDNDHQPNIGYVLRAATTIVLALDVRVREFEGKLMLPPKLQPVVRELAPAQRVAAVTFGDPYVLRWLPEADVCVCAYVGTERVQKAAAAVLRGERQPMGRLPVTIPGVAAFGAGQPADNEAAATLR